jgi:hypothetical protein
MCWLYFLENISMWIELQEYKQHKKDISKYNILYFDKNIDIKYAPKTGSRSIRKYWTAVNAHKKNINPDLYWDKLTAPFVKHGSKYQNFVDYQEASPFRKNSYKIAIYRNPIDRWISACEYQYKKTKESLYKFNYEIDDIIYMHQKGIIIPDIELFQPMTYWLGKNKSLYNATYTTKNINSLMQELNTLLDVHIDPIWENKQAYEKYDKSLLADYQIEALKQIYISDYTNGWY